MTSGSTWWARSRAPRWARSPTSGSVDNGTRPMATALFVCLHNAGRSQMSQALFERAAGGRHAALSAGTTPGEHVHPEVVEVMRELGIDLADRTPRLLTRELAEAGGRGGDHGLRRRVPVHPGQALPRLGPARPRPAVPWTRSAPPATKSPSAWRRWCASSTASAGGGPRERCARTAR